MSNQLQDQPSRHPEGTPLNPSPETTSNAAEVKLRVQLVRIVPPADDSEPPGVVALVGLDDATPLEIFQVQEWEYVSLNRMTYLVGDLTFGAVRSSALTAAVVYAAGVYFEDLGSDVQPRLAYTSSFPVE